MIPIHNLFERKFISGPDYQYNMDAWNNNKTNILLVLGLSGSGKTTDGILLSKKYNVGYISLDELFYNPIHDKFKEKTGRYAATIEEMLDITKKINVGFKKMLPTLKKRFVIEGLWPLFMDPKELKNYSIIIKGTSNLKSSYQVKSRSDHLNLKKSVERFLWTANFNRHVDTRIKMFIRYFEGLK
jgi:hypothetical protein